MFCASIALELRWVKNDLRELEPMANAERNLLNRQVKKLEEQWRVLNQSGGGGGGSGGQQPLQVHNDDNNASVKQVEEQGKVGYINEDFG